MDFEKELNSREKIALMTTGIEGEGQHFVMNGESADKLLMREKAEKFNTAVDEMTDKFEKHNETLMKYAEDLSKDLNGLEIVPMFQYVLIEPFKHNPFQKIEMTKSGIITDLGGYTPEYKSQETGEIKEEEQFIKVGTVVEVGCECKFLQPGDVVFYTVASECMVPFYKLGFVVVHETRIIAAVNAGLKQRKNG